MDTALGAELEMPIPRAWAERIAQIVPVSICFLDRNLVFTWMNPTAQRLIERSFKVPGRALLGSGFREVSKQSGAYRAADQALESGRVVEFRTRHLASDGAQTHWRLLFCPVVDPAGNIEGVLLVSLDITSEVENERLQRERVDHLLSLDRKKNDFLNASSHEIRTPLTSILGFAEFLVDETHGPLNADQRSHVGQILTATYRLERIVGDLLDFARIEAGTFALLEREADLGAVVEEALENMRPQARESAVELRLERPDLPLVLSFDPQRITQVVQNLVSNALKFSRSGGRVDVLVLARGDQVRIEVRDAGVGIAPEDLPCIFERFYQGKEAPQQANRGAGLGLFISRALVEAHRGQIGVESELGAGSTFWFELPAD